MLRLSPIIVNSMSRTKVDCEPEFNVEDSGLTLNISAVERDTGLSKDILRMWERRYGFPTPQRDANGERTYSLGQVEKLQLIKRLMERGHRPGKIISLSANDLKALGARPNRALPTPPGLEVFLGLIQEHQLPELRWCLTQALMKQGLQIFVHETMAPLNRAVGDAWLRGELAVFEEHLYTEQVDGLLRNAIASVRLQGRPPRVLLTTFPNEQHTLGLLMVEALLSLEGAYCISLGAQTPLAEINRAVGAHKADVVAVSFSAAFNKKQAATRLTELRAMLPSKTLIWAGGAGIGRLSDSIAGVELLSGLDSVIDKVKDWRSLNTSFAD